MSSCSVHSNIPSGMPAPVVVNGKTIARDAIVREMQYHRAEKPIAAWQTAARALVIRELLLQRARSLGIHAEPRTDEAERRETEEEAVLRALIEAEVTTPEPDEETCRRYYRHNLARFKSADIYEASHILFAAPEGDAALRAQARSDAEAALSAVIERPDSFAALAQAYSRCPSAMQGGNLGQITAGQTTPEFERTLAQLQPGETAPRPVETRFGFHIVRLERKHAGQVLPFELVACRIADYLREAVRRRASAQYIAHLVSAADISGIAIEGAQEHRVN
jgi:peptidyl-prolyl cis-trans isomerase C